MNEPREKLLIYQIFPRIFTNDNPDCVAGGTLGQNGSGHFCDYDRTLLQSLKDLGVNCLWMTGVIEHATKTDFSGWGIVPDNPNVVKGEAGSPYAVKDYYDVDPALASDPAHRMEEFEAMVGRIHDEGMKVIIDFVPNHTARVYHSDAAPEGTADFGSDDNINYFFSPSNNYYYIPGQQFAPSFPLDTEGDTPYVEFPSKATGNDCFNAFCSRNDWYETVKLNYGHDYNDHSDHFEPLPDTWLKMLDILRFWAGKGVDGFRCDMVFMVPLAFWHWVIPQIRKDWPGMIFIGEIYDVGLYRPFLDYGCFDYLYDKVNLYDTLVGIERHNVSAARLTSCWQTVDGIGDRMLNFLENHDEVRFASKAYAGDPARCVPALVVSAMISRGPLLIYYGQELGEPAADNEGFAGDNDRSTIFDYWSYDSMRRWYNGGRCDGALLDAHQRWLRGFYRQVLHICAENKAISEGGFFDLMYVNLRNPGIDPHRQFVFVRHTPEKSILIAVNFDRENRNLDICIPDHAFDCGALPEGDFTARELLWGDTVAVSLHRDRRTRLDICGSGALVIEIDRKTMKKQK